MASRGRRRTTRTSNKMRLLRRINQTAISKNELKHIRKPPNTRNKRQTTNYKPQTEETRNDHAKPLNEPPC
uniref:Uncharacterized protein n=1 Tax=Strigamia maritima TaxID=126957 RepID=T1IRI7_STRMM